MLTSLGIISKLVFTGNKLISIGNKDFSSNRELRTLNLNDAGIREVRKNAFEKLPTLREVFFANLQICTKIIFSSKFRRVLERQFK